MRREGEGSEGKAKMTGVFAHLLETAKAVGVWWGYVLFGCLEAPPGFLGSSPLAGGTYARTIDILVSACGDAQNL